MKRFRLWIFNACVALSLAFCATSAVFYMRSLDWHYYQQRSSHRTQVGSRIYSADWRPGYIQIWRIGPPPFRSEPQADDGLVGWNHYVGCPGIHILWFTDSLQPPSPSKWGMLEISFWWIMIATFLFPVATLARIFLRNRERPKNYCGSCGYDLRATPNRCPECGTVPPKKETISN
jgi:hypothetical protein